MSHTASIKPWAAALFFLIYLFCLPCFGAGEGANGAADDDLFAEYNTLAQTTQTVADPLYYFNYAMYSMNDTLYFYALKPVARGYKFVVPTKARHGIDNFFNNLLFPVRFVNCVFQGKGNDAANEFVSFFVNSTIGVLGFNDVAGDELHIHRQNEDLGQTLATYHVGDGFYLVLPVLGPSTLRDTLGRAGDFFASPTYYMHPWELVWGMRGVDTINTTSLHIGDYETLKEASLDPYAALRQAYIQSRLKLIRE